MTENTVKTVVVPMLSSKPMKAFHYRNAAEDFVSLVKFVKEHNLNLHFVLLQDGSLGWAFGKNVVVRNGDWIITMNEGAFVVVDDAQFKRWYKEVETNE